jgi:NAD(P)-dependent dehydrogenase (short-subunit alcohol dehydrogenase family)
VKAKVALTTGGGSGLGEAISTRLAQEGATVIVSDIDEDSAQRVAQAIGDNAVALQQDVTVETRMVSGAVESMPESEGEEFTARIIGNIPMGHMGEPLDIANGVLFLASEESKYMTGSELIIDGGYIAR